MVNIAVLGYGTVGSGVVEVINTNHEIINKMHLPDPSWSGYNLLFRLRYL